MIVIKKEILSTTHVERCQENVKKRCKSITRNFKIQRTPCALPMHLKQSIRLIYVNKLIIFKLKIRFI